MGNDRLNYRVKRELISFLYASGSYALPAQLIAMLLVAWMVRSWVPERLWSAWFAISLLGWLCRTFHLVWRRFHRLVSRIRLEYEYFIGSTCAAIFWAMGLLFFMSYLPEPQRMLLVLLSCLYITACAVLLLNSRNCFYGALLPIGLVLSFELLAEPSSTSGVTLMILLFIIMFAELLRRRILHWQTTGLHNRFLSAEMASQLRRRTESLRIASQQDGLTAIANRGKFEEQLEVQWRRCARAAAPLSLLLLDVDYFKQFNDKYGHQAGDDCLRQVAAVLKQALRRDDDLAARYGGEEFVLLLPFTDLPGALTVADSVQRALARLALPHAGSLVANRVTCSLGCARLIPEPEIAPGELVEMADVALYRAKRNGRNRIEVAD